MRAGLGMRASIGAVAFALAALVATPAVAIAEPIGDTITVTQVSVNRLGGVNVAGEVSCAGAYERLVAGELVYDDGGQWVPVPFDEGDLVVLSANNDNYTVSQPAGRKTMIQVTHGSSRMNPCYLTTTTMADGSTWDRCEIGGPCRWTTDAFGHDMSVPLFDYSPDGKFKAGLLNVHVQTIGLLIQILNPDDTWETYFIQEGSYAMTSVAIKAVGVR